MGLYSAEKLAKLSERRPFWIHGVSVGEVQAAVPLIKAARTAGYDGTAVISTTTKTGRAMAFEIAQDLFDLHVYYPWDRHSFVSEALSAVNPWAFAATETELWPNMLWELQRRGIPAFLVNGRVSDRTLKRLEKPFAKTLAKTVYSLFTEIYLRDESDRERLRALGVDDLRMYVTGDTKIDALIERKRGTDISLWQLRFRTEGESPVFIAGSTHEGEDEVVLEAFKAVKGRIPDARLIIAPRHPERSVTVLEKSKLNFHSSLLSENVQSEVTVADKIGVLFGLYAISSSAFVGGSFVDKGGQNILEPAVWGIPVQFGPHMEDFRRAADEFLDKGAAARVLNANGLAKAWIRSVRDAELKELCTSVFADYFARNCGASDKIRVEIEKYRP